MHRSHLSAAPALALAAAFTAAIAPAQAQTAAAPSSVTVYGLFDATVRRANNVVASDHGATITSMEDGIITGTRLGFRGNEDLGAGWRASFVMESGFDPSSGNSLQGTATADYGQTQANPRFWGREVNVSLTSPWAGVTLGRQYTTAHQIASRFQPLGNPNNTAFSLFSSHHIARQDNVVRLGSKLGGVELMATHTLGEVSNSSANGSWSLGGVYASSGWAAGAYVQEMKNLAGTEERRIIGLGGNYRINAILALYAGYMERSAKVSVQENKAWGLGANIEVAEPVTLSLQYFDDKQTGSAALEGSRKVAWVQANYRFSKRTDVYAAVDQNKVAGGFALPSFMAAKGSQTAFNVGLRTRF